MASNNVREEGESGDYNVQTTGDDHGVPSFRRILLTRRFSCGKLRLSATLPLLGEGLQEFNLDYGLSIT